MSEAGSIRCYTVSQIARAIGCTRQNAHRQLASLTPDGEQIVSGQRAKAWRVDSLPPTILRDLATRAQLKRYPSVTALLNEPFKRYELEVPFALLAPQVRDKALKLQRAMGPFIALRNSDDAKAPEFARRGTEEYRRVIEHQITGKHWRDLFDRTIERDNGNEEWDRPEIYVEENPPCLSSRRPIAIARERGLEVLEEALTTLAGAARLTVQQKTYLWMKACDELQLQVDNGAHEKKIKRAILKTLLSSGRFGADKETIRRNLNRQWRAYCHSGEHILRDRRTCRKKEPLPEGDKKLIAAKFLDYDGCLQHGWDAARASGELTVETQSRYSANRRLAPNRVRREVTAFARSLIPAHKGPRAFQQSGPYIQGDYSQLFAGEVHEMDDGTPETVCYVPSADFPGYRVLQGQIIADIDRRTGRALGFGYVEDAYHGRVIRSTAANACIDFGLCKRLNIERGLWEKAKQIVGRKTGIIPIDQWEMGLREFMRISHARGPQGKAIIERFFGFLWDRLRPLPGYCGPDMRKTCPELLQRQIREARAGKIHPSTFCLSKEEFLNAIAAAMAEYNSIPQSGRLKGLSPNEAWDRFQSPEGLTKVTNEIAYLISDHREPHTIRRRQILRKIGGVDYIYHSPITAQLDRRQVLLWTHPDDLAQVSITSMDRKEGPWSIPLVKCCTYKAEPDGEAIQRAQQVIDRTNSAKLAEYRSIQPFLAKTKFRITVADRATIDLGANLAATSADTRREMQTENRTIRSAQNSARKAGLNVRVTAKNAERTAQAADLLREVYSEEESK